jgi:class I fructose-bisphosphate aldolase
MPGQVRDDSGSRAESDLEGTDMAVAELSTDRLTDLLGDSADDLLGFSSPAFSKDMLHLPGPDFIDRVFQQTDRDPQVLRNLHALYASGRLANTGYMSILPIDQGIEHSAAASFAPNPMYFDPENLVRLALEGGCNAIASTLGVLGATSRKYAHKIPYIVKINHNELMTSPNEYDQILFSSVQRAWELGAAGVGATIYFGSAESRRQIVDIARCFEEAHRLGMFTVLWCYLRSPDFVVDGTDYHLAADLTGQANHLGVTIEADIIKQKLPENNGGYNALNADGKSYGKTSKLVYEKLTTDNPIDLCRWQVVNCYNGRAPLINSGGASSGETDLAEAVRTAVINKRAGGTGLISGRKAFQRPMDEGVALLHAVQDVYLNESVTVA